MKTPRLIIGFFNPGFLKRLDRYLLLNHPRIWISKIYYVFYYGLLANIILNFLVFIFFSESSQSHLIDEFIHYIIVLVMLIEVVAFCYWFFKQCLFNIEKEHGNFHFTDGVVEIVIYTVCTIIIFSSSLTMTATAIHRVANNDKDAIIAHNTDCGLNSWEFRRSDEKYQNQLKFSAPDKSPKIEKELQAQISLLRKWQSKFCYNEGEKCEYSGSICRSIQKFITNDTSKFITNDTSYSYHKQLRYDLNLLFQTIFAILGIYFLIITKHNNSDIIGLMICYIAILAILSFFLDIFVSSADITFFPFIAEIFFHIDPSSSSEQTLVGLIFVIVLFMIFVSIQLAKKRKYAKFIYINFLSLPLAVGVLIFSLGLIAFPTIEELAWILIKFFLVYSCFMPLQKMVLNHVLSLPKE